ncbi:MAG: hypothetical protein RL757_794 [Bacteroidota bacterium]|jgi:hypothetical protein
MFQQRDEVYFNCSKISKIKCKDRLIKRNTSKKKKK